jgi:hypothetical protein
MAGLPPPPTRATAGDYIWLDWYNSLQKTLTTAGAITWNAIDKAGSSLADLQVKAHSFLTGVLGNGSYHLSATEQSRVAGFIVKAGAPTTSDISAGTWALYKDSSGGSLKLYANDGGTIKSVTLT